MLRLDGSHVAQVRQARILSEVERVARQLGRAPGLAVVLVGSDPASQVYVRHKVKTCEALGMKSWRHDLSADVSQSELLAKVAELNSDPQVDGILVQLPLPGHLDEHVVVDAIDPRKDPDGLTTENLGLLWGGRRRVAPCTPWGVMAILEHYQIALRGVNATVIGRSKIVGKPMAHLLTEADATVTLCHSKTTDLLSITREADIVVVATGRPRFLGRDAFRKGAVVVDVGIHRPQSGEFAGRLCGDVKFEELDGWVEAATPVPGGVGPMTITMLMENTLHLSQLVAKQSSK